MNTANEWWSYEPPPTIYDLVGKNLITFSIRPFLYIFIKLYFRYFHKVKIIKPKVNLNKGEYILVANHSSHLDTPLIFSCFPLKYVNKIYAVAAADYFFTNPFLKIFANILCNIIPINRERIDFRSLSICENILKNKGNILIYPEGTRTRTGEMGEFKHGVGILFKKTNASVLPVYIKGTFESMNYKRIMPKPFPVSVIFGAPISFQKLIKDCKDTRVMVDKIKRIVLELSRKLDKIMEEK